MRQTPLTEHCDAAIVDGILAAQEYLLVKSYGCTPDGKFNSSNKTTHVGANLFAIGNPNSAVRHFYPDNWPRLQDIEGRPSGIEEKTGTLM